MTEQIGALSLPLFDFVDVLYLSRHIILILTYSVFS